MRRLLRCAALKRRETWLGPSHFLPYDDADELGYSSHVTDMSWATAFTMHPRFLEKLIYRFRNDLSFT